MGIDKSPQQREGLLHALIQAIPDLVWLKDGSGTSLLCNSALERFFGAPELSIVRLTDHNFISPKLAGGFILELLKKRCDQPTLAAAIRRKLKEPAGAIGSTTG